MHSSCIACQVCKVKRGRGPVQVEWVVGCEAAQSASKAGSGHTLIVKEGGTKGTSLPLPPSPAAQRKASLCSGGAEDHARQADTHGAHQGT